MLLADRYRLDELVGRGGMGEVWCAEDEVLRRPVAVKVLLPQRADDIAIERFRREARAAAVLSHPNVVAVYDFGTHEDSLFLVMELVEGRTLTEELAVRGTLPAVEAAGFIAQAAAGLAVAHDHGLVHRDIKPGNLLLTADGTIKVADFGIARFVSDAATDLTSTGQIVGTTYYLAPERAKGDPAGPESDIYSLGCVLYQLVTGHPPFDADTPAGVLYQHVDLPPVPPAELRPELAGPFQDGLLRKLAKDPAERPTAAQLSTWSLDEPPAWNRPAIAAAVAADAEPATPVITPPSPADKSRTRVIQTVIAAAGAAAVSTAVVVALALNSDPDKAPPTTEPPAGTTPSVTRSGGPASNPTAGPSSGNPSRATGEQTRQVLSTQFIIGQQTTAPNPTAPNLTAPNPTAPNATAPNPTGPASTGSTAPAPTSKPRQPRDTPGPTQPSASTPATSSTQPPTSGPTTGNTRTPGKPTTTRTKPPKPAEADTPTAS